MPRFLVSQPDDVCLCEEVQSRFLDLCHSWMRVKHEELPIPESLQLDMLRWRQMAVRHRAGDYRHTDAESKSVRTIAQYLVDLNCDLRNQPRKVVNWEPVG